MVCCFLEITLYDIDALEAGVLGASHETMREALAEALERASRDKATEVCGEKGGSVKCSSKEVITGSMAK